MDLACIAVCISGYTSIGEHSHFLFNVFSVEHQLTSDSGTRKAGSSISKFMEPYQMTEFAVTLKDLFTESSLMTY